jgi:pimeloyl-ACP methyl ester carboxylesterase
MGGGFGEPAYMFNHTDQQSPWDRRPNFGFRCVKLDSPPPAAAAARIEVTTCDFSNSLRSRPLWWRRYPFASPGGYQLRYDLPEVDPFNFGPHVTVPVLMLNGRYDQSFPLESSQLPLFRYLGTPAKDKQHVVWDGGHGDFPDRTRIASASIGSISIWDRSRARSPWAHGRTARPTVDRFLVMAAGPKPYTGC